METQNKLAGEIVRQASITEYEKKSMINLLKLYFYNVNEKTFLNDLKEKKWVIVLRDSLNGDIRGFSTQTILDENVDGIAIKAIFSGDTIIDKSYWGSRELPRVWGHLALSLIEEFKDIKLYWFYISKGYMTYLLMQRYFNDFYPRYDKEMPQFAKKVLDTLAMKKYPAAYDKQTCIIKITPNYYLKENVANVSDDLLKNPHINFFVKKNPMYTKGYELACLAEINEQNMKPSFRDLIRSGYNENIKIW